MRQIFNLGMQRTFSALKRRFDNIQMYKLKCQKLHAKLRATSKPGKYWGTITILYKNI